MESANYHGMILNHYLGVLGLGGERLYMVGSYYGSSSWFINSRKARRETAL